MTSSNNQQHNQQHSQHHQVPQHQYQQVQQQGQQQIQHVVPPTQQNLQQQFQMQQHGVMMQPQHQLQAPPQPVSISDQSQQYALAALASQLQDAMGGGGGGVVPGMQLQQQQPPQQQQLQMACIPTPQQQQQVPMQQFQQQQQQFVAMQMIQNHHPPPGSGMPLQPQQQQFLLPSQQQQLPQSYPGLMPMAMPPAATAAAGGLKQAPPNNNNWMPATSSARVVTSSSGSDNKSTATSTSSSSTFGTGQGNVVGNEAAQHHHHHHHPSNTATTNTNSKKSGTATKNSGSSKKQKKVHLVPSSIPKARGGGGATTKASKSKSAATSLSTTATSSSSSGLDSRSVGFDDSEGIPNFADSGGIMPNPGNGTGDTVVRAKRIRERNREHAKSTRLRKKAYVQKLKEMAEGLRAIQTEEVRQRRVAVQRLSEVQKVRKSVVQTFLRYHANYESNEAAWSQILVSDDEVTTTTNSSSTAGTTTTSGSSNSGSSVGGGTNNLHQKIVPPPPPQPQPLRQHHAVIAPTLSSATLSSSASAGTSSLVMGGTGGSGSVGGDGSSSTSSQSSSGGANGSTSAATRGFSLKQPVTPFRWFRPSEVERDYRMVRGISSVIADAASMSVMVERIGYLNPRWQSIKRKRFLQGKEDIMVDGPTSATDGEAQAIPHHNGSRHNRRRRRRSRSRSGERGQRKRDESGGGDDEGSKSSNNAMSSLSSSASAESSTSSNSSNSSREDDQNRELQLQQKHKKKRSSPALAFQKQDGVNVVRDAECGEQGQKKRRREESPTEVVEDGDGDSGPNEKKSRLSPLSSEESLGSSNHGPNNENGDKAGPVGTVDLSSADIVNQKKAALIANQEKGKDKSGGSQPLTAAKIAKSGGIVHSVRPVHDLSSTTADVVAAVAPPAQNTPGSAMAPNFVPPVPIPSLDQPPVPFHASNPRLYYVGAEYVRRRPIVPAVILNDPMGCTEELGAYYSINEDDMILMDDILMCPFVFRSKNAVLCGALADCVMPGMLRAQFSATTNKLASVEMVYDAMGFMQQLDRSNGGEVTAQIIPGSLEMALMHTPHEARAVTEAKPPYSVVHVNESWTKLTKYSQIEAEGQELWGLLQGANTVAEARTRPGKPAHRLEDVATGLCACSTNVHYTKGNRPYVDFMCSYPLTNADDEITHLLHVHKELPKAHSLIRDF